MSNDPLGPIGGNVEKAIAQVRREAVDAIGRNQKLAEKDPYRPTFHYTPPGSRMNDPNGPAWHNGWHHLFYQHMVFIGSGPARDVHWGHARSRDLVNWETLPLAIPPSYELGELSVFSGNLAWDKNGDPVQFTTMVPYRRDTFRQIWAARPVDDEWIVWEKDEKQPPEGLVPYGPPDRNLKDAFPFSKGDRRFLVLTDRNIPIYEAVNDDLTEWIYRGALDDDSAECPNFFEVDGKWVYLSSPHAPVHYVIGKFDADQAKFSPETKGLLNHDMGYYATTAYRDDQNRTVLHGITRGQRGGRGWTGALSLPRILSIGDDNRPRMHPVEELKTLRGQQIANLNAFVLDNESKVIKDLMGDTIEIIATFKYEDASSFGLRVRRSADGSRYLPVKWENGQIVVARPTPNYPCYYEIDPSTKKISFRIFLDKGIIDALTNDGKVFESRVVYPPLEDLGVEVFSEGGRVELISLEAWEMKPAEIDHSRLLAQ